MSYSKQLILRFFFVFYYSILRFTCFIFLFSFVFFTIRIFTDRYYIGIYFLRCFTHNIKFHFIVRFTLCLVACSLRKYWISQIISMLKLLIRQDLILSISVIVLIRINIHLFFQCIEIRFWVLVLSFELRCLEFLINLITWPILSKLATFDERAPSKTFSIY